MELAIYNTPIARRCSYMGAQSNGGLLKPIWDAAFKPWKLSKELIANCNLIPLCHHIWELISDHKATYTTISHLQFGLCILLCKQYDIIYQKSINLSRLLTLGQEDNNKNLKQLTDCISSKNKKINNKKKPLKAITDAIESIGDELLPIDDEVLPEPQHLQLVPYTIEMMSLVDDHNPDPGSNTSDNYWTLLINELNSINEDDKTTFIDSLINENNWSINETERGSTHYYDDLDTIFNDALSGEKQTPPLTNSNNSIIITGEKLSIANFDLAKTSSREKNYLKYDTNIFTPKKPKRKKLQITNDQQTLFDIYESNNTSNNLENNTSINLNRKTSDSIISLSFRDFNNNYPCDKTNVIESALLKLVDEAVTKQDTLEESHMELIESQNILNEYIEVPKENFLHDLNSSSTRKLLSSYNDCLGPGKKLDFTIISQNCTRHEAALMFYRTLLLSNGGLVDLHQEYSDYTFNPIYVTTL